MNKPLLKKEMNALRRAALSFLEKKYKINIDQIIDDGIDEATDFVRRSIGTDEVLEIKTSSFLIEDDIKTLLLNVATLTRLCMLLDALVETFEDDPSRQVLASEAKDKVSTALTVCVDLAAGYAVDKGYVQLPDIIAEAIKEHKSEQQ